MGSEVCIGDRIELVDASVDLATSGIDPGSSRSEQIDVVARSAAMASSGDGAEPGVEPVLTQDPPSSPEPEPPNQNR